MNSIHDVISAQTVAIQIPDFFMHIHGCPRELREEFKNARGYQFPWGFLTEEKDVEGVTWDFYPVSLYQLLSNVGFWTDWFEATLGAHPAIGCDIYALTDGDGSMASAGLLAEIENEESVRHWLASIFLPSVWPDVVTVAQRVGKAWDARDLRFYQYAYGAMLSKGHMEMDRGEYAKVREFMCERYGSDICF